MIYNIWIILHGYAVETHKKTLTMSAICFNFIWQCFHLHMTTLYGKLVKTINNSSNLFKLFPLADFYICMTRFIIVYTCLTYFVWHPSVYTSSFNINHICHALYEQPVETINSSWNLFKLFPLAVLDIYMTRFLSLKVVCICMTYSVWQISVSTCSFYIYMIRFIWQANANKI